MCYIRQAVVRAMHDQDMNIAEVADKAKVSRESMYRWFRSGKKADNAINSITLGHVLKALNLTVGYVQGARPLARGNAKS